MGNNDKPEEIFHIIEHFCLGRKRLHLFGNDTTVRPGERGREGRTDGWKEGGRDGGTEGRRDRGREGGRERGREGGREGRREGEREGRKEGERDGRREGEREGGIHRFYSDT